MKNFFIVIFCIISLESFSQVELDSNLNLIIKGDAMLFGSSKTTKAMSYGYIFEKFDILSCGSGEELDGINKISEVQPSDSTLLFRISIESNCCKNYLAEIEIVEDSILNVIYHDYGYTCMCNCNFCLDYKISYSPFEIKKVSKWEQRDLTLKYAMINGDRRTLYNIEKYIMK